MACTFKSGGYGPFRYIGAFLEDGAPDFGPAPTRLMITARFRSVRDYFGMPGLLDAYHERLTKLPKVKVLNKGKLVEIEYLSNVCMGDDFEGPPSEMGNTPFGLEQLAKAEAEHGPHPPARPYDAELLRQFCAELLEMLPCFRKRLAKIEKFDFDRFLEWAAFRFKDLPNSDDSLKQYADAWLEKLNTSPRSECWDDLLIDWSKYHPRAREVLDDLFYWDCVNELAPHGNDEGADLLKHFERWRKRNKTGDSKKFLERLMQDWGMGVTAEDALEDVYEPSVIGLAFAHLKVDAACPSWVRDEALQILLKQKNNLNASEVSNEDTGYLDMMIKKLEEH